MTHQRYARFAIVVLAANLLVIAWGAYVRATGSGAGCGNHWPLCNGEVIPRGAGLQTLIEYSHRASSGLALLLVVALFGLGRKLYPAGHPVRLGSGLTLAVMLLEAALGAGLVLFELVADNATMARALFMATHLGNTFLLLAVMTLTAWWAGGGAAVDFGLRKPRRPLHPLMWTTFGVTTLIGMSGAVAALGDTLFPSTSLAEGFRQDLSATSHILIQLRVLHPLIAIGGSCLLLYLVARVRREKRPATRPYANALNLLVFVQVMAGGINMILLAPVWMQLLHLLLADLVWIALILTCAAALPAEDQAAAPLPLQPAAAPAPTPT